MLNEVKHLLLCFDQTDRTKVDRLPTLFVTGTDGKGLLVGLGDLDSACANFDEFVPCAGPD